MQNPQDEIEKLQAIIHQYTSFFIIFDIIFFITIILIIIFAIQVLKSRKKLKNSSRYLRFTIKGQEEERARIARELHDTVAQDLAAVKIYQQTGENQKSQFYAERALSQTRYLIDTLHQNLSKPFKRTFQRLRSLIMFSPSWSII